MLWPSISDGKFVLDLLRGTWPIKNPLFIECKCRWYENYVVRLLYKWSFNQLDFFCTWLSQRTVTNEECNSQRLKVSSLKESSDLNRTGVKIPIDYKHWLKVSSKRKSNAWHYYYQWFSDCPEGLNTNKLNQYNLVSCSCPVLLTNTIRFKTERLENIANSYKLTIVYKDWAELDSVTCI